jgi:predicted TIM-barrel fold metal-dependent hydrolase
VLLHVADPKEYWDRVTYNSMHYGLLTDDKRYYDDPNVPEWEELIRQRDRILEKHPNTTFIGAHMGSLTMDLDRLAETFDKYANFYVDCSARLRLLGRLNRPAVRDFFVKYQDRILFGTDDAFSLEIDEASHMYGKYLVYFETDRTDLEPPLGQANLNWLRLAGVSLPPEVLEKLYHRNAERLLPGLNR